MLDVSAAEMLTLAAITYRGMLLVGPSNLKRLQLRRLMNKSIDEFSAVKGKWKIVWGPATFSPTALGWDDALMYVAQSITRPSRVAIAIRGTNTPSVTDWVFGDLMIQRQTPWPYGDAATTIGAKISASTALELSILNHMRWDEGDTSFSVSSSSALPPRPTPGIGPASIADWARAIDAGLASDDGRIRSMLSTIGNFASQAFDPLSLLGKATAETQPSNGTDLKGFLRSHVATHPDAEVIVTGHSKGGTLSTTTALWLADTRGSQRDGSREWSLAANTPVYAWSFAGPTAGNRLFADHSRVVLGDACHRIWNIRDIAPYAFVSKQLPAFSAEYDLSPADKVTFDILLRSVARAVQSLDYQQLEGRVEALDCPVAPDCFFPVGQLAHQHMDAYLEKFGLAHEMTFASLIEPEV